MTELLAGWLRPLAAGALLCAVALGLTPEGKNRAAVKFVGGVLMTVLLLRPLMKPEPERLAERFAGERLSSAGFSAETEAKAEKLYSSFIQKETEEYIWSAAERLGIRELGVRITMREGDTCPYPYGAALRGSYTEAQRESLAFLLEGELGIPRERQDWSRSDAGESEEAADG